MQSESFNGFSPGNGSFTDASTPLIRKKNAQGSRSVFLSSCNSKPMFDNFYQKVIKPLCGTDSLLLQNLETYFTLQYPKVGKRYLITNSILPCSSTEIFSLPGNRSASDVIYEGIGLINICVHTVLQNKYSYTTSFKLMRGGSSSPDVGKSLKTQSRLMS